MVETGSLSRVRKREECKTVKESFTWKKLYAPIVLHATTRAAAQNDVEWAPGIGLGVPMSVHIFMIIFRSHVRSFGLIFALGLAMQKYNFHIYSQEPIRPFSFLLTSNVTISESSRKPNGEIIKIQRWRKESSGFNESKVKKTI